MQSLTLVIPAFNEAEGVEQTAGKLRPVLERLRSRYVVDVVFVNDGSRDDTARLLLDAFAGEGTVQIISHAHNQGLGAALRTGFQHAQGELIVTTDFDGTYDFGQISELVDSLDAAHADLATASPYHPLGRVEGVPQFRLLFSRGASLLYRLLVSWKVHTWTALFRAYRRPVIERIGFASDDFLAGTEILVNAMRAGFTVVECPMVLRQRTFGQSSIRIARVTLAHLRYQLRILFRRYRMPAPVTTGQPDLVATE